MRCVEKVGLIKFDFLGLKTLTAIADAERRIRAGGFPDFSVDQIPLDDEPSLRPACAGGDTEGVFQLESSGMTDLVVKLKPRALQGDHRRSSRSTGRDRSAPAWSTTT